MTPLPITIVLLTGATVPVSLPDDLPSGHVAQHTAASLGLDAAAAHRWAFVRVATGDAIDPGLALGGLGLAADEPLSLAHVREEAAAAEHPAPPDAVEAPAAEPVPEPTSPRPWPVIAAVAASAVLVVAIIVGVVVALSGGNSSAPAAPAVAAAPVAAAQHTPTPARATTAASSTGGSTAAGHLATVDLEPSADVTSFAVSLPPTWRADQLDALASDNGAGLTRHTTKLVAPTGGASVLVDNLVGFDQTAESNRASLDATYARSVPGYRRVAFLNPTLPHTDGFEWRYVSKDDHGRLLRHVDVMFDLDSHSFAVLVTAHTADGFADMSTLARRIARSIEA